MKFTQVGNIIQDISNYEAEDGKGTVIDSGTTLTYFPEAILNPLKQMVWNFSNYMHSKYPFHMKFSPYKLMVFYFVLFFYQILSSQPNLTTQLVNNLYECFDFEKRFLFSCYENYQNKSLYLAYMPEINIIFFIKYCSIDDSFPTVIFGFENSLQLKVYPHDYLIPYVSKSD